MAFALIGIDIILRIVVIEKRVADRYNAGMNPAVDPESTGSNTVVDDEDTTPDMKVEEAPEPSLAMENENKSEQSKRKLPTIITLLAHPRLLNAAWGSLIMATITTSFETIVSPPKCLQTIHHSRRCRYRFTYEIRSISIQQGQGEYYSLITALHG